MSFSRQFLLADELKKVGQSGSAYSYVIKSQHRIPGRSLSNTDFYITPHPQNLYIRHIQLKYASIPFAFRNVTTTYGDSFSLSVFDGVNTYNMTIVIAHAYYTIVQLVELINLAFLAEITLQSIPVIFSLSVSGRNNYLQLNTSSLTAQFTFTPTPGFSYISTMLGVDPSGPTLITFTSLFFSILPFPFTEALPFRSIYIHLDPLDPTCFTSLQSNATFVVPTDNYRPYITLPSGEVLQSSQVVFETQSNYEQDVFVYTTPQRFPTLHIRLTDEEQNDLSEHAGNTDWMMVLGVFGTDSYKTPISASSPATTPSINYKVPKPGGHMKHSGTHAGMGHDPGARAAEASPSKRPRWAMGM